MKDAETHHYPSAVDPKGLLIRGAVIPDDLDLNGVDSKIGLRLTECELKGALTLCDAKLPWLELRKCTLTTVAADRAQIGTLTIHGGKLTGQCPDGTLRLEGADVASQVTVRTHIDNRSGPALMATGLKVGDSDAGLGAVMDGLDARGESGSAGAVCLSGAKISGGLALHGARLRNFSGPALTADGLTVQGDLMMTGVTEGERFTAIGAGGDWAIRLMRASITGQLSLEHGKVRYDGPDQAPAGAEGGGERNPGGRVLGFAVTDDGPPAKVGRSPGAVCLSGATITGNLVLRNAYLVGGPGPALMAENLTVKGHVGYCESADERFTATASSEFGAVCLPGANIAGQLSLCGAALDNCRGPALMAELITIQEDAVLNKGFKATGAGKYGAVRLKEAKISGDLALHGARLRNFSGPALTADGLTVQGDLMMTGVTEGERFTAIGAGGDWAIRLMRASITGQLSLEHGKVRYDGPDQAPAGAEGGGERNPGGRVLGFAVTDDGPPAKVGRSPGAVCLSGATITGNLVLRNAYLVGGPGPALMADYLTAKGDAALCEDLSQGFVAIGTGELGAVCLGGANITGQLSLCGTTLINATGPALVAAFAQIQGDTFLNESFAAVGAGKHGTVYLVDASFTKVLRCSGAFVYLQGRADAQTKAPALDLTRAKVGTLYLDSRFEAHSPGQARDLEERGLLEFDGLTYTGLPKLGCDLSSLRPREQKKNHWWHVRRSPHEKEEVDQWIYWFQKCTAKYAAQPYQALAAAYEGAGYDNLARHILVRGCDDARTRGRGSLSQIRRTGQFFSKYLIGYGYHCVGALAWLAGLFAVTALFAVIWLGPHQDIVTVSTSSSSSATTSGAKCSRLEDIGYAINVAFPIINLSGSSETQCDVRSSGSEWVIAIGWVIRGLAATLAAVYALGISGLNRSSPSGSGSGS